MTCQLCFPEIFELQVGQRTLKWKRNHGQIYLFPLKGGGLFSLSLSALFRPSLDECARCCGPTLVGIATGSSIFSTTRRVILAYLHYVSYSPVVFVSSTVTHLMIVYSFYFFCPPMTLFLTSIISTFSVRVLSFHFSALRVFSQ